MRSLILILVLLGPCIADADSCSVLDATYPIFSSVELKINHDDVLSNYESVSQGSYGANSALTTSGAVQTVSYTVPAVSPSTFPSNSSSTDIDETDSPVTATAATYYNKVNVGYNKDMEFKGGGPFHIKELIIEDYATLELDAGVYYVDRLVGGYAADLETDGDVTIHIGTEFTLGDYFNANKHGDSGDLLVVIHENSTAELKYYTEMYGALIGQSNSLITIGYSDFYGTIISDGPIEVNDGAWFFLYASYISDIELRNTCSDGSPVPKACGPVPNDYPVYSGEDLKVDKRVTINGNSVSEDDYGSSTGLELDGEIANVTVSLPDFDPTSFPTNSASTDLDEDDSPLDGSSEVFYDKIETSDGSSFTFSGAGPFHIDELKIGKNGSVHFSAGVYFIRKLEAKDDSVVTFDSQVRLYTNDEIKTKKRVEFNKSGNPEDVIMFIYADAKFETDDDSEVVATILGKNNDKIKLDKRTTFTGLIISDGKVELKDDVAITLTSQQLTDLGKQTTCIDGGPATVGYFVINHDGAGINCLAEVFTVTAKNSDGTTLSDFSEQITISTQTGDGNYALSSGNGSFADSTSNDGLMVYTFDPSDVGTATFTLSYEQGTNSFDLDSYLTSDTLVRDDDTEGNLVFSPSGFTVTQTALSNPPPGTINDPIGTQTAGTLFDVHIAAYGQSPTDPSCGIIEDYTGAQNVAFWIDYANPTSGTLVPTVDGSPIAANEGAASSQSITFSSGQASVPVRYKDVGQVQIELKDGSIRGATAPFVVQPSEIVISLVETSGGAANPAPTSMSGTGFVAAGEPFTVQVEVRDSQGSRTPNYGNETSPEGIQISSVSLIAPAGGSNGSADDGAMTNATRFSSVPPAGTLENTTTSWDEIGIIQLQASIGDGDYLGSGNVIGTASSNVGRFVPASFTVVSGIVSASCGNQTYMGEQGLGISYQVEARGSALNVLKNYDTSLLGSNIASLVIDAENSNSGVDLSSRVSAPTSTWVNGIRSAATSVAQFSRGAGPDGPYENLQLGLRLIDVVDSLNISNPDMNAGTSGDCSSAANCNAKTIGSTTQVHYGRMEVINSFGPETTSLEVPLRTMIFDGSGFVVNSSDSCSDYEASRAALSNYQDGLPTVSVLSPGSLTNLVSGVSNPGTGLFLSSPGATNMGSVDLTFDAPSWLEFDWFGSGAEDPMGTAIFGQFRGHDKIIYWRELY